MVGVIVGAVGMHFVLLARAKDSLVRAKGLEAQLAEVQARLTEKLAEAAAIQSTLDAERRAFEERKADLLAAKEELSNAFKALSGDVLRTSTE